MQFSLAYLVDVLPGGNLIKDNSLFLDMELSDDIGQASIHDFKCLKPDDAGVCSSDHTLEVFFDSVSESGELFDSAVFDPVGSLSVNTAVFAIPPRVPRIVELVFEQRYSEVAPVPEPATMLLLGTGLAGIAGLRKKNSRKNK